MNSYEIKYSLITLTSYEIHLKCERVYSKHDSM